MAEVINRKTAIFSHWMDELKQVALAEYNFELGFNFNEKDLYYFYDKNMDVYEAIETYKEQLVD